MAVSVVRRLLAVAGAVTLAFTAGCGGGSAPGSSGTGDSIKIMTWASLANPKYSAPQVRTVAEARVKAINDAGGIKGRRLELIFCDTNYDPNTEAGCARQAQAEGVAAVVGALTTFPGTFAVLERARIPFVGSMGFLPPELVSPVVFPLAGGVPGTYVGALAQLKSAGVTTTGLIACNSPACSFAVEQITAAVAGSGLSLTGTASLPTGTPDPSAAVAQALAADPQGLVIAVPPNDIPKVVQAVRRSGFTGTISSSTSLFPPATITALGPDADGILLTSQVLPLTAAGTPAVAQLDAEVSAIDPGAKRDENAELAWGAYVLFQKLAERLDTVDAGSVFAAMNTLDPPIDVGITAPYSTVGKTSPLPGAPRLFNPTVYFNRITGGTVEVTSAEAVDPFTLLRSGT